MKSKLLVDNFKSDLVDSLKTPLFIEINSSDVTKLQNEDETHFKKTEISVAIAGVASSVYGFDQDSKRLDGDFTNVLLLSKGKTLFDLLYDHLEASIKQRLTRSQFFKAAAFTISKFGAGAAADYVASGLESVYEQANDLIGSAGELIEEIGASLNLNQVMFGVSHWLKERGVEEIHNAVTNQIENSIEDIVDTSGSYINDTWRSSAELYLADLARQSLNQILEKIKNANNANEATNALLAMMMAIGLRVPKIIVIDDPYSLDEISFRMLMLIAALSKELKYQKWENGAESIHSGISFVLLYSNPQYQLNSKFEDPINQSRQKSLIGFRRFCQRYELLERLDSDIPKPFINRHAFVGRKEELLCLRSKHEKILQNVGVLNDDKKDVKQYGNNVACNTLHISLIKGEPGTGKSALARRFLQARTQTNQLKQLSEKEQEKLEALLHLNESQVSLQVFNSPTLSSATTGLDSLIESIVSETHRLESYAAVHQGFSGRIFDDIKTGIDATWKDISDALKKQQYEGIGKRSKNVLIALTGYRTLKNIVELDNDKIQLPEMARYISESLNAEKVSQRGSTTGYKSTLLFSRLMSSIDALSMLSEKIAGKKLPLLLYIDDLQWIDESVAEFILNHLMPKYSIEFLVTARGSDSVTKLKLLAREAQSSIEHFYTISLLSLLGISCQGCNLNQKLKKKHLPLGVDTLSGYQTYLVNRYNIATELIPEKGLKGMNKSTLAELIHTSIVPHSNETEQGQIQKKVESIAQSVIQHLQEGKADEKEVVTLFAIETLNVLGDPKFFKRGNAQIQGLQPVFMRVSENPIQARIDLSSTQLLNVIDMTFFALKEAYQSSYQIDVIKDGKQHFNLASYAIMEERLELIKQYFNEYGDAALFSLLFSSLLGSPFSSKLINHLVTKLTELKLEEIPELTALITLLKAQPGICLREQDYEVLEESYEILRRLQKRVDGFEYRHNLFDVFLKQQLENTLYRLLEGNQKAISKLAEQVYDTVEQALKDEELCPLFDDFSKAQALFNIAEWGFGKEPEIWAVDYINNALHVAKALRNENYALKALELLEVVKCEVESKANKQICNEAPYVYSKLLYQLAILCGDQNRLEQLVDFEEQAQAIALVLYESDSDSVCYTEHYVEISIELGAAYLNLNQSEQAYKIFKQVQTVVQELYESNQMLWGKVYITLLIQMSVFYGYKKLKDQQMKYAEQALKVSEFLYQEDPKYWGRGYSDGLANLAAIYSHHNLGKQAISLADKSLQVVELLYTKDQKGWESMYADRLMRLAIHHMLQNHLSEQVVQYIKKALKITEKLYQNDSVRWTKEYVGCLTISASVQQDKEIQFLEQALRIIKGVYEQEPIRWTEEYSLLLGKLSDAYQRNNLEENQSVMMLEYALEIVKRGYEQDPARWKEHYSDRLANLALAYLTTPGRFEKGVETFGQAIAIMNELFESDPQRWGGEYAGWLDYLAAIYKVSYQEGLMENEQASEYYQEAVLVTEKLYEQNPKRWENVYLERLDRLILSYESLNNFQDIKILIEKKNALLHSIETLK
ncbi:hypothetical protein [Thiomicrorhabdus chilensis]|uniref:hypothetical protein n=1 Tax=Thiomicrorhabdus chilensis TaxID=63656 RepID=UPI00040C149E|nr:hypothetical protein [Thiomicrorhabdus chilensis]